MRFSPGYSALTLSALAIACVPFQAGAQTQSSFSAHTLYSANNTLEVVARGDFNGDGRDDFIALQFNANGGGTNYLFLSNGDGTYDAPIALATPLGQQIVTGDFNGDGKLDYAALDYQAKVVHVWINKGGGTFTGSSDLATDANPVAITAADMNHDNITDVIIASGNGATSSLQVWMLNTYGSGGTASSVTSGVISPTSILTGDFDGDGKPDVAVVQNYQGPTTVQIWYGDGKGHLASPYKITDPNGDDDRYDSVMNPVGDFNNDGKSDILMYRTVYGVSGTTTFSPQIAVFSGTGSRALTFSTIGTTACPHGIQVADFNGDGVNDLAYAQEPCSNFGAGPETFVIRPGTGSGAVGSDQDVYSSSYYAGGDMMAIKSTQGTKPDLIFTQWTAAAPVSGAPPQEFVLLTNSTTGSSFPGCGTTNQAVGINVCAPSGSSANSPLKFSVSAAGPTPMRAVAVWVDGQKLSEQLTHAFSDYSFLDQSLTLSSGTHNITVYGTGWDNTLQQKKFTLSVGGASGCGMPASPGVNVCKPANGSTVGSPVEVQAAANITGTLARMEIWVDGVKKFTETTSTSLDTTLAMASGYHKIDIYAANTAGNLWETTTYATVGTSNGCAAPSSPSVNVCSPVNASTVHSPVQVVATANIVGTLARMEVWVNNGKMYTETTSTQLSTTLNLAAGTYQFDIYAVNTQGAKYEETVRATVQ
ncbi:MAG TPA: FG-GAP-like repeat-containing protein [Terracidiphilus sp.]